MKSSQTMCPASVLRLIVCFLLLIPHASTGQVLISLLLGDDLNTGKIEFGLDGGASIISQGGAGSLTTFNLGFYFDIRINDAWIYHTGVIVKSTMGAGNLPVYSLGDAQLDDLFKDGHVDRTMNYFNVPFFFKYKTRSHFYVEAGPQLGLLYGAKDEFKAVVNGEDLSYTKDVRDFFKALDAGMGAGIGYRLMKGNGMNLGFRYYYGLSDVSKAGAGIENRSLYINVGIPIGAGKAREKREQKKKECSGEERLVAEPRMTSVSNPHPASYRMLRRKLTREWQTSMEFAIFSRSQIWPEALTNKTNQYKCYEKSVTTTTTSRHWSLQLHQDKLRLRQYSRLYEN